MSSKSILHEALSYIYKSHQNKAKLAVVLGSGLGGLVNKVQNRICIEYKDIPFFNVPKVQGHSGQLVFGQLDNHDICIMQGRLHLYEGLTPQQVTFPIQVLKALGIESLLVTNASGAINTEYHSGDFVQIKDHMNLTGLNPLIGNEFGQHDNSKFLDMGRVYQNELSDCILKAAQKLKMNLRQGIYAGVLGPCYETPAEVRMLRAIGADMVGMSTVHEVIVGHYLGMKVAGLCCISNSASGLKADQQLSHVDIQEVVKNVEQQFFDLLINTLRLLKS